MTHGRFEKQRSCGVERHSQPVQRGSMSAYRPLYYRLGLWVSYPDGLTSWNNDKSRTNDIVIR